jgi:hypothetical protein
MDVPAELSGPDVLTATFTYQTTIVPSWAAISSQIRPLREVFQLLVYTRRLSARATKAAALVVVDECRDLTRKRVSGLRGRVSGMTGVWR